MTSLYCALLEAVLHYDSKVMQIQRVLLNAPCNEFSLTIRVFAAGFHIVAWSNPRSLVILELMCFPLPQCGEPESHLLDGVAQTFLRSGATKMLATRKNTRRDLPHW